MIKIISAEVFAVDIPFKKPFKHAAAERLYSESIFVKVKTSSGHVGYGETLPRKYVTGETRDGSYDLLKNKILPNLKNVHFDRYESLLNFLRKCDGKPPADWNLSEEEATAAWCAIDIALLDAYSKAFDTPVYLNSNNKLPENFRYSPVISADFGFKFIKTLLKIRLFNCKQIKLKLNENDSVYPCSMTRKVLGRKTDIRVDANMAWSVEQASSNFNELSRFNISSYEQPLAKNDFNGLAKLTALEKGDVMVDESLSDKNSLDELIAQKACSALNVRISKCGGLVAAYNRCMEGLQAGMKIQIGCLTGESSLLSAANLQLVKATQKVTYGEGCFGKLLLKEDPVEPLLQIGYGGKPPVLDVKEGFGVKVNENILLNMTSKHEIVF